MIKDSNEMHGLMACNAKIYIITIHRRENLNDSVTVYSNALLVPFILCILFRRGRW